MGSLDLLLIWVFYSGVLAFFLVFIGYPGILLCCSPFFTEKKRPVKNDGDLKVSLLVVFRNADQLLAEKVDNFLSMDYPSDNLELVLISDGSNDGSQGFPVTAERIQFHHFDSHQGKIHCINYGVSRCRGDIVVFSDVDAILEKDAIKKLTGHFQNPGIGGVCGQRVVREKITDIASGQLKYIQWDSAIKRLEVRVGQSVTSHDGKLYAIRKELFSTVPPGVTDDAYISLSVTKQGLGFVFEPDALAYIKMPSVNARHELNRRKRIVSTSLRGLWLNRKLFNPVRYGFFSAGLFVNKVLRRMIPFCLIGIFVSSGVLMLSGSLFFSFIWACQVAGYLFFLLYPLIIVHLKEDKKYLRAVKKISALGYFFCVGMAGTFLGVISFLSGEEISKWDPVKK